LLTFDTKGTCQRSTQIDLLVEIGKYSETIDICVGYFQNGPKQFSYYVKIIYATKVIERR
jgi:hypothetical protein